jgi:hypothetical protein
LVTVAVSSTEESRKPAFLTARATINRDDFGLGGGMMVQSAAGKTATVEIALVAVQRVVEEQETPAKVGR